MTNAPANPSQGSVPSLSDLGESPLDLLPPAASKPSAPGLEAFLEILTLHQGPGIYFVLAPSGTERQRLMAQWAHQAQQQGYEVLTLSYTPTSPIQDLLAQARPAQGQRIFFVDLSDELSWATAEAAALPEWKEHARQARQSLQSLNLARERLRRLDAPLFFWMSPEVLPAFARFAADLFAVRSGVLDLLFPPPAVRASEALASEALTPFGKKFANLPREEIESRIRLLHHALAEEEERARPNLHRLARYHLELAELQAALNQPELALNHAREALTLAQTADDEALQAESWYQIGHLSWMLGEIQGGLTAAEKASVLYRRLAERHPDRFRPDLARALNSLGAFLSALGRHEDALAATREAVDIRRLLAQRHPDRFLPDLAMSLNNLGNRLSALGRHQEALQATKEAVALYRDLAQRHPDRFLPDLAGSLNNLGAFLSVLGRHEEALQATQEAVVLYRDLAQRHPDRFLPDLAMSLNNLGAMLANLGRHEEALQATKEAVVLYRDLAQRHPDRFLPDLAMSLNNLGNRLSALGRHEEALQATQEAVAIRRRLAQRHPDRFLPDLAMSLNNLGNIFSALGRPEEALQATKEAVALYRDLAQRHPDRFLPDLARSLGARGAVLLQAGRPGEAAEALAQGLQALLPLARRLPQAYDRLLADLLNYYQRACRAADREPDADLVREAQAILGGAPSASE